MNIFVCFDNNDCLVTKINCTLEEAVNYYVGTYFDGAIGKRVIDIDKPFYMKVEGVDNDYRKYTFDKIDYDSQIDFRIVLDNHTDNKKTSVEPAWFYAHDKRKIIQEVYA